MKYWLFLFLISFNNRNETNFLICKDVRIEDEIIKTVYDFIEPNYRLEKSAILLNINKVNDCYEIKTAGLEKDDFRWYLMDKKDKLYGYTEYKGIPVVVFGNSADKFYEKTKVKNSFDYLTANKYKKPERKSKILEEPLIFEPMGWIYLYKNDVLELITNEMALDLLN